MPDLIAVPAGLQLLRRTLVQGGEVAEVALPLRALQARGLSEVDLILKVERIRTENALGPDDPEVEDRCLIALDLIHGATSRHALRWDAAARTALLLPRAIARQHVEGALDHALAPSDLLPPRVDAISTEVRAHLLDGAMETIEGRQLEPVPTTSVRVPKRNFTSRPAAVLGFSERLALEALAGLVEVPLAGALPSAVVWPRSRETITMQVATEVIRSWDSTYVAKADVANFYEVVEHSLLAVLIATRLEVSSLVARSVEALLTAIMGLARGLPQGPGGSDILASAYLLAVDQQLTADGIEFVRYADDYFFPAETVGEGRARITRLEELLADIGLGLGPDKTAVMGRQKFIDGIERPEVEALKRQAVEQHLHALSEAEVDAERFTLAAQVGLAEQTVWDLLYHQSIGTEEVLENIVAEDVEAVASVHELYLATVASALRVEPREHSLATLSRVARESLAVLTHSDIRVSAQNVDAAVTTGDLATVQLWFPELTPAVTSFLVTRLSDVEVVARLLNARLRDLDSGDWVDAWAAYGAGVLPAEAVSSRRLQAVLRSPSAGPLTKAEAARALLRHGELSQGVWTRVRDQLPAPMRAELIFAAIVEPDRPDWLRVYARERLPPVLDAVRRRLVPAD